MTHASNQHPQKPRKHLLNFTLRGLPELDYFPNDAARQEALNQIATEAGNPQSGGYWMALAIILVATILFRFLAKWLLSLVLWPRLVEELLVWAAIFGGFLVVLRWLHRSGAARDLRNKLLAQGVPICLPCGYLLRGLLPSTSRCPECGAPFSDRVAQLLAVPTIAVRAAPLDKGG